MKAQATVIVLRKSGARFPFAGIDLAVFGSRTEAKQYAKIYLTEQERRKISYRTVNQEETNAIKESQKENETTPSAISQPLKSRNR